MEIRLTVLFDDPFWVGIFEKTDKKLSVCKVTFGAEPKDADVYEFVLQKYFGLAFSPAVASPVKTEAKNPKRRLKLAEATMRERGIGTKAQQALKLQREMLVAERKTADKVKREELAQRKFELKQEKKKEKHRGH